ncbi:MAG: carbon monoxide dehydrogenase [Betaproteobacteria bacterium]|nr:carbon monoxide dehydrogenase [Betaproteobacteria bacterium]
MDIKGEERISVPIQTVWEGLNSTDILLQAIPGCESIERINENELQAKIMIKLGPVTARFSGKVSMSDIRPLQGYTLNFEGSGGAAGFAKGSAEIRLQDADDQTLLTYNAKASIGGKLGQLGSRLIEGSAKKLSAEFFSSFAEVVCTNQPKSGDKSKPTEVLDGVFATKKGALLNFVVPKLLLLFSAILAVLLLLMKYTFGL